MFKRFIEYLYIKYVFMPELMGMNGPEMLDYLSAHGANLVGEIPMTAELFIELKASDSQIRQAMYHRQHNPLH